MPDRQALGPMFAAKGQASLSSAARLEIELLQAGPRLESSDAFLRAMRAQVFDARFGDTFRLLPFGPSRLANFP